MKRSAVVACAVLTALVCALYWLVFEADVSSESYRSYSDADGAGLFRRGWLPSYIPVSASSISEIHDVDTNERCASFSIAPADLDSFAESLLQSGFRHSSDSGAPPPQISPLRSCPFVEPPHDADVILSRPVPDTAEVEYFGIFEASSRVYFWSALR
jgi:hypothetical protein